MFLQTNLEAAREPPTQNPPKEEGSVYLDPVGRGVGFGMVWVVEFRGSGCGV